MKPIQSNQLRIGNLVQDRNGVIMRVVSIHEDGTIYCDFEGNEGGVWEFNDNNPCYGIELTKERLLKYGFLKMPILENHFYIVGMLIWKCEEMFVHDKTGVQLKHLHKLQNLYFALTGKELL